MKLLLVVALNAALLVIGAVAQEHEHHHPTGAAAPAPESNLEPMPIPDVELVNQRGERVHFYSDLVKNKAVAIQTVFTTCTTICPPMGAAYERLQKLMAATPRERFNLISISIDPQTDTPERLREWAAQFHAGPEWTLLTGSKVEVDRLLKALGLFVSDKQSHTPLALVGSEKSWRYFNVLSSKAAILAEAMQNAIDSNASAESAADAVEHRYFTDVVLVDQNENRLRFYTDVLKNRVVVIDEFFTSCNDSCPMMASKFVRLQEWLGDRLGRDVFLVSVSVDPANDTPEKLRAYAERFKARPGWIFLTGSKENVDFALGKLGAKINQREDHTTVFLIGNTRTHLWKKVRGTSPIDAIVPEVQTVVEDRGSKG